jgi:hypothetical protein
VRTLSAANLLALVEYGAGASPTATALAMLASANADLPETDLAGLPLGARDRLLLELRGQSLGGPLQARVSCPGCAGELELALDPDALVVDTPPLQDTALQHGALELIIRPPTSADLLGIEACADEEQAKRRLAARCIVSATRAGAPIDPADAAVGLDTAGLEALGEAMAAADPQADLSLELRCAECGTVFERELDVAAFVAAEFATAAQRLFGEVHALARGYGWREADILAMSAWRRRAYAGMLWG